MAFSKFCFSIAHNINKEERKKKEKRQPHLNMIIIKNFILLLAFTSLSYASGWNDYVLDIGNGYKITKISSSQIDLLHNGLLVISSSVEEKNKVGPIYAYSYIDNYILAKNNFSSIIIM